MQKKADFGKAAAPQSLYGYTGFRGTELNGSRSAQVPCYEERDSMNKLLLTEDRLGDMLERRN